MISWVYPICIPYLKKILVFENTFDVKSNTHLIELPFFCFIIYKKMTWIVNLRNIIQIYL